MHLNKKKKIPIIQESNSYSNINGSSQTTFSEFRNILEDITKKKRIISSNTANVNILN